MSNRKSKKIASKSLQKFFQKREICLFWFWESIWGEIGSQQIVENKMANEIFMRCAAQTENSHWGIFALSILCVTRRIGLLCERTLRGNFRPLWIPHPPPPLKNVTNGNVIPWNIFFGDAVISLVKSKFFFCQTILQKHLGWISGEPSVWLTIYSEQLFVCFLDYL